MTNRQTLSQNTLAELRVQDGSTEPTDDPQGAVVMTEAGHAFPCWEHLPWPAQWG